MTGMLKLAFGVSFGVWFGDLLSSDISSPLDGGGFKSIKEIIAGD